MPLVVSGIKKAVRDYQLAKAKVERDIESDEAQLKKLLAVCKEKQLQLSKMQCRNRELEATIAITEDAATQQQDRCETERHEHNKQSKILMGLRDEIHDTKMDFKLLLDQIQRVKEDIIRTDNLAFNQHSQLHGINEERQALGKEIKGYNEQISKLNQKRDRNSTAIDNLCREIDIEDKKMHDLQKQYKYTIVEKDIIVSPSTQLCYVSHVTKAHDISSSFHCVKGAHLIATQLEIDKVQQNMKPLQAALVIGSHRFSCLKEDLEAAHAKTQHLLAENRHMRLMSEKQEEQSDVLAQLERDLTNQIGKNQVLTVELGKPVNLHRWRHLQNSDPERWSVIEKVHKLQKQVILSTDKVTSLSSKLASKRNLLANLKHEVSHQVSIDSIKHQLEQISSNCADISKEIKINGLELQARADNAEVLKNEIVQLEKKRMNMKSAYIVSVISSN